MRANQERTKAYLPQHQLILLNLNGLYLNLTALGFLGTESLVKALRLFIGCNMMFESSALSSISTRAKFPLFFVKSISAIRRVLNCQVCQWKNFFQFKNFQLWKSRDRKSCCSQVKDSQLP